MFVSKLADGTNLVDIVLNMLEGLKELVDEGLITEIQAINIAGIQYKDWKKFTSTGDIPIERVLQETEESNSRAINLLLSYTKQLRKQHQNGFKRIKEIVKWEDLLGDNSFFKFQFGHDKHYIAVVEWDQQSWSMRITVDDLICFSATLPSDLALEDFENALNYATNELVVFILKTII